MDDCLCCPDCGCVTFTQTRIAQIEYALQIDPNGGEHDISQHVTDGGDRDAPIKCEDCGREFDGDLTDELSTVEQYNANADAEDDLYVVDAVS